MRLSFSTSDLVNLIAKIQAVFPENSADPILKVIFLEAINSQIALTASDPRINIRALVQAQVEKEGSVMLSAKIFFQLVLKLTYSPVTLDADPTSAFVQVHAGPSHFKMSRMHPCEYPSFVSLSGGISLNWDSRLLKDMLTHSSFAAARESDKPILNGVLVELRQKTAAFVGTDRHRIARVLTDLPEEHTGTYVIPLKAAEKMVKLLETSDQKSKLTILADKIGLETDNFTLVTPLVPGRYPDIVPLIPQKAANPIVLNCKELLSLLSQVAIFATNKAVRFTFTSDKLHLTAFNHDIGGSEVCLAIPYSGPKFDIVFNSDYFLDILRHSKDETIELSLDGPHAPGLITDSTKGSYVIMPMTA
jgi:DNA polymerase-3 subunit beta